MKLEFFIGLAVALLVGGIVASAYRRTTLDIERCKRAASLAATPHDTLEIITRDAFCGRILALGLRR